MRQLKLRPALTFGLLVTIAMLSLRPATARASAVEKVLFNFDGTDGISPSAGLIFDAAGNLYGTTSSGGANGTGTVFELSPNAHGGWTDKVLYSFGFAPDGVNPMSSLVFDSSGNLYGTTFNGGVDWGTVFELSPGNSTWTETILYTFTGGSDGGAPLAGLVFDAAGNLYGTTERGGAYNSYGTVFELTPGNGKWTETVLHSFGNGTDGRFPVAGVIFDAAGNLYGTTEIGGSHSAGVVFELTPSGSGWKEKIIHTFGSGTDGVGPEAGLTFDGQGNLYGTTHNGGADNYGSVFELSPTATGSWTETRLHNFTYRHDGSQPAAGVTLDSLGNVYGTDDEGGAGGYGVAFEISLIGGKWQFTTLHAFGHGKDGAGPYGGVILDSQGNLYGTTALGGKDADGTVFEITPTP